MVSSFGCAHGEAGRLSPGGAGKDASASQSEAPRFGQRFPRCRRLTTRRQFLGVYRRGRRLGCSSFTLFCLPNSVGYFRLGLTVPRKVGKAVRRNRVKRVLRDAFRRYRPTDQLALDLVVDAHPGISGRTSSQIEREFLDAIEKIARRGRS